MNGHSTAETLAFELLDAKKRLGGKILGSEDRPIFVIAAGWHVGEVELGLRLAQNIRLGPADTVDPALLERLAWQFLYFARRVEPNPLAGERGSHEKHDTSGRALSQVASAQASLLRALAPQENDRADGWGLAFAGVTADYAHYLKLLFPNAKILFLHRDPIETFQRSLMPIPSEAARRARAASFAEGWCKMVSGFLLWRRELDALVASHDQVIADAPSEIEKYLGQKLSPLTSKPSDEFQAAKLDADEREIIADRSPDLAARLGYRVVASDEERPAADSIALRFADRARPGPQSERCVVLVPTTRYIEPDCEAALSELERRGYAVRRLHGCSAIDAARNRLATWALDEGFDQTLWVDADTGFDPDVVDRLRLHELPIVAGICAKKSPSGGLAVAVLPGTGELVMGSGGGLVEVLYAGTGFMLVRREVYRAMQSRFDLPLCSPSAPHRSIPFFMPMLEHWGGEMSHLAEDYAFSRPARLCGYKIMTDTSIRLWHIGMYRYGYEDAGNAIERVATYRHVFERLTDGKQRRAETAASHQ